jgi:rRNA maturation RNase YbeY
MMINIDLTDKRHALDSRDVRRVIQSVFRGEKAPGKHIDVIFCRDKEIIVLNKEFKGSRKSTDVLAFDLSNRENPSYLGEVYVNLQMARRQAALFKVPYMEEVKRLAIHGVLHLLGFRDDTTANRARMWEHQESYLENGSKRRGK